jgi:SAM-dependent methyltransferase
MLPSALRPESETQRWYEDKVRRYGFDYRGLGFRTRTSQEKRFDALLALGDFDGRSILDVGCGFADLLEFAHERGIRPTYTGIDICAPMIERCRERFPSSAGVFEIADVIDFEPGETYDYAVASGIFGLDALDARERIGPTLERLFAWSRIGVAVNFLSERAPHKVPNRLYVDPCEALECAYALTPSVRLDHSYLPNDFTVYLYKRPLWLQGAGETQ